jgi:hypothetical protein
MFANLKVFFVAVVCALTFSSPVYAATDSYRWLHVTIDTPWAIFIFLLPMVLLPAIVMAILYWKFAGKKPEPTKGADYSDKRIYEDDQRDMRE